MELLEKLYAIHSPSGGEKPMRKFIRKWVTNNIEGVELHYDNVGNMYFTKGKCDTYPCVVAHLDQVQSKHSADFTTFVHEGVIYGWSPSSNQQEGLGADDKNGIWIALKCLERFDVLKVAFFNSEEIGCVGSRSAEMDFFKDCRFIIQPDRRGAHDLITEICYSDICSDEFKKDLDAELFGYVATNGLMTDVLELSERGVGLSCINVSCGYYEPHTNNETTRIEDLVNCYNFVAHIIGKCTKVYPHQYEEYTYTHYKSTYGGGIANRVYPRDFSYDDDYYGYMYGYDNYYNDDQVQQQTDYEYMQKPYIPQTIYYDNVLDWIDDLIGYNFEDFFPEDLWEYVEDTLYGTMDKSTFLALAEDKWEEYYQYI